MSINPSPPIRRGWVTGWAASPVALSRERPAGFADLLYMITKKRKSRRAKSRRSTSVRSRRRGSEKRGSERSQFFAAASLYTELSPDVAHKVWVTNISLGGLAFRTRRVYEAGQSFHIQLEAGPIDMNCPIRIIWSRQNSEGSFEVGAEFIPD